MRIGLAAVLAFGVAACGEDPNFRSPLSTTFDADVPPPSTSADKLISLGDQAAENGDIQGAIALYDRAAVADRRSPIPLVRMAILLEQIGQPGRALTAWRRADDLTTQANAVSAQIAKGLGRTLLAQGQGDAAANAFREALATGGGDDPEALNGLAASLDHRGRHGEAQDIYWMVLKGDEDDAQALNNLGLSLALSGDLQKSIYVLERAARGRDSSPAIRQNLALAYGLAGLDQQAMAVSREDLPERQVLQNIAAYQSLRAMDPHSRAEAVLGATLAPRSLTSGSPLGGRAGQRVVPPQ